ncbi:MAG TPA: hypothetical protein VGV15_16425 [Terriglobales bacterium]|nr:hypothetical protein [Terriglobales bacterium]
MTVVLQEEGKGATWMFEDAYAKHRSFQDRQLRVHKPSGRRCWPLQKLCLARVSGYRHSRADLIACQ